MLRRYQHVRGLNINIGYQRKLFQDDGIGLPERSQLCVVVFDGQLELTGPRLPIPLEVLEVRGVLLDGLRRDRQVLLGASEPPLTTLRTAWVRPNLL